MVARACRDYICCSCKPSGFGVPPGIPTWGNMLNESRTDYLTDPLLAILPGLALTIAVLAINFVGDGLRDAFDPKGNRG